MEVILNDYSINGQFSYETFNLYMTNDVLPVMRMLDEYSVELLKSYDIYDKKITDNMSLQDYVHKKGDPIVDRFKSYLISLAYTEPYWEMKPMTSDVKEYICEISKIPNCITEAFERKAILFSFISGGFDKEKITLTCDKKDESIINFTTKQFAKKCLADMDIIELWNSNSFFVEGLGYKFEVRFNEGHHNLPHFHLSNTEESASLSIPDADIIEGKLKNEQKAISWSLQNMNKIVELWNKYHQEKLVHIT